MTAINVATDIPNSITTLEQLASWAMLALAQVNPTFQVVEGVGINERAAQAGVFFVPSDNKYRLLMRLSVEMSPNHLSGGEKFWTYAQPLSNNALPAVFKP